MPSIGEDAPRGVGDLSCLGLSVIPRSWRLLTSPRAWSSGVVVRPDTAASFYACRQLTLSLEERFMQRETGVWDVERLLTWTRREPGRMVV